MKPPPIALDRCAMSAMSRLAALAATTLMMQMATGRRPEALRSERTLCPHAMQNFRKHIFDRLWDDLKSLKTRSIRPGHAIGFHQFHLASGDRRARQKLREKSDGMPESVGKRR
jgi:hypothetical protein